jgi:hypothetical protein
MDIEREPLETSGRTAGQDRRTTGGAGAGAGTGTGAGNGTGAGTGTGASTTDRERKPAGRKRKTEELPAQILEVAEAETSLKPKKRGRKAKAKIDGAPAASFLIEMVETFACASFGEQARFSAAERFLIEPSLSRLIERYGNLADRYAGLIDPLMLGAGALIYGLRMVRLAAEKTLPEQETPVQPSEGESVPLAERESKQPTDGKAESTLFDRLGTDFFNAFTNA